MMERPLTKNVKTDGEPLGIGEYENVGGYQAARKALKMTPLEIQKTVKDANLRGRGGAGFNTGMKWSFVPMGEDAPRPKYLIVNADEMEPGTFKDRMLMETHPHQLLEGIIIAAHAVQAEKAYIFLRWEYKRAGKRLESAIAEAYEKKYLGGNIFGSGCNLDIHLHTSAGRYICGEETALINALEGKRPNPRAKPPFPQICGIWGKPTVVNNAETICNVPHIVNNGAEWYKGLSLTRDGGTKIYGVSGRVKRPGWWELPMGTTMREIFEEHAGGMMDGFRLKGIIPGGASTEFLTEEHLDVKMDFDSVRKAGSRLGTGNMIVLDDKTCPVGAVLNLQRFFARESCGWCTPCWGGLQLVKQVLEGIERGEGRMRDLEVLEEHTRLLGPGRTFCALAPGAMEPLQSALKLYRKDFEGHIEEKRCPYR